MPRRRREWPRCCGRGKSEHKHPRRKRRRWRRPPPNNSRPLKTSPTARLSSRRSPTISRGPCGSCVGSTIPRRLAAGLLAAVAACYSATGPAPTTPRIDYVDGAIEPVLVRGQSTVIEGFGFGDVQGTGGVTFPAASGAVLAVVFDSASWSDREIRVTVPDSAVSGSVAVTTGAGQRFTASVHVLPRVPFDPATFTWVTRTDFPQAPVGVALAAAEYPGGSTLRTV